MTKEEFEQFIGQQKDAGLSEEEIAIVFSKMFQDGKLEREQYEACLNAIGYELSEEYKAMPDDELKKNVVSHGDAEDKTPADKKDEEGQEPPKAPEGGAAKDEEPKKEEPKDEEPKPEPKDQPKEEEFEEEDEESQAMRLFGLKK